MAVYDKAYDLAKEIKESTEYLQYKEIKEKVYADEKLKSKIKEFDKKQYETQLLSLQGEQPSDEKMKELQDLYAELMNKEDAKKYFDCEVRFNVMLADVNKIIGEAVKDVLN